MNVLILQWLHYNFILVPNTRNLTVPFSSGFMYIISHAPIPVTKIMEQLLGLSILSMYYLRMVIYHMNIYEVLFTYLFA